MMASKIAKPRRKRKNTFDTDYKKDTLHYNLLKERQLYSPVFRNKTLSYMQDNKPAINYSTQTMLALEKSKLTECCPELGFPGFMNITFLGLSDRSANSSLHIAEVDINVVEFSEKTEDECDHSMEFVGTTNVVINPPHDSLSPLVPSVTIPPNLFSLPEGRLGKSYVLSLDVRYVQKQKKADKNKNMTKGRRAKRLERLSLSVLEESEFYYCQVDISKMNRCLLSDGEHNVRLHVVQIESLGFYEDQSAAHRPTLYYKVTWSLRHPDSMSSASPIMYQLYYNNKSYVKSETRKDLNCLWCNLHCKTLYMLLKHLSLCHSRFTFTYVPISSGARIDVERNTAYVEATNCHPDLPSNTIICRPKRPKPSLSEFMKLDHDGKKPFITGHCRHYNHTTGLQIDAAELLKSDDDDDSEWLVKHTRNSLDRLTNVNQGAKELMKMWNTHMMKYAFVGARQIPLACDMFLEHNGKELLEQHLFEDFALHMCNLSDLGLVSAVCVYETMQKIIKMVGEP